MNNLTRIEKRLTGLFDPEKNADAKIRREVAGGNVTVLFLSSLVDSELIVKLIESLEIVDFQGNSVNHLAVPVIEEQRDEEKLKTAVFEGNALLFFHRENKILICDVKKYPSRAISYPEVEKSVRGSKDSFNENLIDSIALIRRRIKSETLRIEMFQVSEKSKMSVALLYMEDLSEPEVIEAIRKRIEAIEIDSLIMSDRALEEVMFAQERHIFPLVRYTERPDVASINLMKGKAVLLVDTSCNAIITPISIFDHFKNVEEHKQNPLIGTFTKTLRLLGSMISMFLVPLFILLTISDGYDNGIIPLYPLELKNPLLLQVIVVSLVLEIIRIAVVHTPNALTSALSLLAAIVLGEVSLSIGLFSPEILLVTSIAIICNFATPSYELSLANRLISLIFVVTTCIFGVKGFLLTFLLIFLYLAGIRILGVPYLYPVCPFDFDMFKNIFIRRNSGKKK